MGPGTPLGSGGFPLTDTLAQPLLENSSMLPFKPLPLYNPGYAYVHGVRVLYVAVMNF